MVRTLATWGASLLAVRWFVRFPIWLYRARLGILFGSRLLMLEHIGRRSGVRRYVALEVIDHPAPDTYVVVSGFGAHAQWFRNVRANPRVRVYLGSHRPARAIAQRLTREQTAAALTVYSAAHPRAWAALRPVLEITLGSPISERGTDLPMIALTLADHTR